ncbi:MAG: FecR family protein [bacterium]
MGKRISECFLTAVLFTSLTAYSLAADAGGGIISAIQGDVKMKKAGDTKWENAALETIVKEGDTIKTGQDSSVKIVFNDGSVVHYGALTFCEIKKMETDETSDIRKIYMSLTEGSARLQVEKHGSESSFEIETPTALCGVRGTDFEVEVEGDVSTVTVFDGEVDVENRLGKIRKKIRLAKEHSSKIRGENAPTTPLKIKKEILKQKLDRWSKKLQKEGLTRDEAVAKVKARLNKIRKDRAKQPEKGKTPEKKPKQKIRKRK